MRLDFRAGREYHVLIRPARPGENDSMNTPSPGGRCGITRRGFLVGAAAGLAAGVPLTWAGTRAVEAVRGRYGAGPVSHPPAAGKFGMPGPFPGRVVQVRHLESVSRDHVINGEAVHQMMDRGMTELTEAPHPVEAWRFFFEPDDVVGIKVNPVGRKPIPSDGEGRVQNAVGAISSPEVLLEVVAGLKSAGVKPQNILVFERYASEFVQAGYDQVMGVRDMDGVRWYASSADYDERQVDIEGFPKGRSDVTPEIARHVAGYDPDQFVSMGFCGPEHDPKDDRRLRSHLSVIVTRLVNKIVTIPVLKDHRSAGVTLALKNLSHGMNNNVARSHLSNIPHGGMVGEETIGGPNQCNTFIPTAVAQDPTRRKATLHILDGLIGVYEGGPGCWNRTWATWHHQGLFFATDPVALDHVGWDLIDRKRAEMGWPAVGAMGLVSHPARVTVAAELARLAAASTPEALAVGFASQNLQDGWGSEAFDRRQPEHIILAGEVGLGVFDARGIDHRQLVVSG
jgi:hypothetical protein